MSLRTITIHISICAVIGAIVAAFTPAKWIAASLWVSAALYINGSIAKVEDGLPGGFDNPEGTETPRYARGWGTTKFALQSLAITIALAGLGLWVQYI